MRYLVRTNALKDKIDYIAKQIVIIEENIDELDKIKATIVWEGEAARAFLDNYNNYLNELQSIKNAMVLILKYLTSYCDGYTNSYLQLRNKYSNNKEI